MFSGIVETMGTINFISLTQDCLQLNILPQINFDDLNVGGSVSVNGVCLTVTKLSDKAFYATVVPETMRLTNLSQLVIGSRVNLERSIKSNDRIGGHYVQGHIDCIGEILDLQSDGEGALLMKVSVFSKLAKYIVSKGYVALDGMSMTVIEAASKWFTVTLIPHTQQFTIANFYQIGNQLNIEVDISALKEIGNTISIADLKKSPNYTIQDEGTRIIVSVTEHKEEAIEPETTAEAPEILTEKPAEGEVAAEGAPAEGAAPAPAAEKGKGAESAKPAEKQGKGGK